MTAQGEYGRLRIGIHALIPRSFLTELIRHYREEHTGIEVEITEGTARDAVMQLRADQLDVVFVAGKPEMPDCHTRPIWTEPLVAVLSDGHRLAGQSAITWSDLVGETFIVRYGGTARRSMTISCCALPGVGPHRRSGALMWGATRCYRHCCK
nr:LysR family substrate-binding domain-containing protein [Acinetobacter seifertii]